MTLLIKTFLGMIALVFSFQSMANDWSWYHGDDNATRYSNLDQINKGNIANLNGYISLALLSKVLKQHQ